MNKYLIWGANGALIVVCCFLAGGVLADLLGSAWLPATAPPDRAGIERQVQSRVRSDVSVIRARNLFNVSTLVPELEPEPEPEEDLFGELDETELPLKLLGTAAAADERLSWAAVEDLQARKHLVVATNHPLKSAEVVRIERRRIVLRNEGRLEELALDEDEGPAVRRAPRRAGRRAARRATPRRDDDRITRLGDRRFAVDRDEIREQVRNPATLLSEARILPKYEEGQMVGIQLNSIKEGSLFQEVGLTDGDVIVEFNGESLGNPAQSADFLQQLMTGDEFEVLVRGADGAERTLNFQANP